MDEEMGYLKEG
jgi:hypothetical protein